MYRIGFGLGAWLPRGDSPSRPGLRRACVGPLASGCLPLSPPRRPAGTNPRPQSGSCGSPEPTHVDHVHSRTLSVYRFRTLNGSSAVTTCPSLRHPDRGPAPVTGAERARVPAHHPSGPSRSGLAPINHSFRPVGAQSLRIRPLHAPVVPDSPAATSRNAADCRSWRSLNRHDFSAAEPHGCRVTP